MALNFQQVFDKIHQLSLGAHDRKAALDGLREHARHLFESWSDKTAQLAEKVERARQVDPSVRCAIPLEERLDAFHPAPAVETPVTLIAADGSQILPDRHAEALFYLVNVGAIVIRPGSGHAPDVFTDSSLFYGNELYTETGMLAVEAIEQGRDIQERKKLLDLAKNQESLVIAMTDGPVELWGAKDDGQGDYRKNLEVHKAVLSQLQAQDVTVAGYVDKPGADLLIRTLEIATLTDDKMKDLRRQHPLRGVTDRWLFQFLPAGCRSAVFGLQSGSRAHYTGSLGLHFFYLNVGAVGHPWLVRVEIPAWVNEDGAKIELLHKTLLDQCSIMGAKPFPYILHRAHEAAVVKFQEKQQIEQMLQLALRKTGGEADETSAKQAAKESGNAGRKRYK